MCEELKYFKGFSEIIQQVKSWVLEHCMTDNSIMNNFVTHSDSI